MSLKSRLRAHVPASWRRRLRALRADLQLARELASDWRIFRRWSGLHEHDAQPVLEARILKAYHRLEKGLALAQPRPGFGPDAVALLLRDLDRYIGLYGPDHVTRAAINTLQAYLQFNARHKLAMTALHARCDALAKRQEGAAPHAQGGVLHLQRAQVQAMAAGGFEQVAASRYSVRQFAPGLVSQQALEAAVRCAQKAPSVCNRQAGVVYAVRDRALQQRLLAQQNGNRGFGDQADLVLLVGARLSSFLNVGERYQAWIDGGLFTMSLLHGLHAQGLGTCCLNWSVTRAQDRALKRAAGLADDVEIMMLVAVGHLPEHFSVAQSPRRPLAEVLHTLG